jgi:branched-chain amino acid aminotransferase
MNSRSDLYGAGVFTTIRIIDGKPWLWEKHSRRLLHDAARLNMDLSSITIDEILGRIETRIKGEDISDGRLRLTISDKRIADLWPGTGRGATATVTVQTAPLNEVPRPFRLGVSAHLVNSTSPLAGLKTGNYLEPLLAAEAAREQGFHEAVRLNERGQVTSACMANVFWARGDQLFTPTISTGCLPGTTREFVMENLDVSETEASLEELKQADAIFLTSAGLGVVAADEIDGRPLPRSDHAILDLIPHAK